MKGRFVCANRAKVKAEELVQLSTVTYMEWTRKQAEQYAPPHASLASTTHACQHNAPPPPEAASHTARQYLCVKLFEGVAGSR
jgi:hypothetical protein